MRALACVVGITCLALANQVRAEEQPKLKSLRLDFSVPDVPAFTVLGVSPSIVSRPGNVRELALALASGLDADGHLQSGLALEIAPIKLLDTQPTNDDKITAIFGGLRVSVASDQVVSGADTLTKVATGVRWSVLGYQPETDGTLRKCIAGTLPDTNVEGPIADPEKVPVPNTEIFPEGLETCRAAARAAHLASSGIEFAYAHASQSTNDARVSALEPLTDSVWFSAAYGINSSSMTTTDWKTLRPSEFTRAIGFEPTIFARMDMTRVVGATSRQKDLFVAARLPLFADGWSVFLEGGWRRSDLSEANPEPANGRSKYPIGFGGDVRLGNGTWLGVYGGVADANTGALLALGNLKWSLGEERPYAYGRPPSGAVTPPPAPPAPANPTSVPTSTPSGATSGTDASAPTTTTGVPAPASETGSGPTSAPTTDPQP